MDDKQRAITETDAHIRRMEAVQTPGIEGLMEGLRALWGVAIEAVMDARERMGSIWDAAAPGITEAVTDVRKRVVEEGWFGREVSPKEMEVTHHGGIHGKADDRPASAHQGFYDLCRANEQMKPPEPPDQGRQAPDMDR